jgi:predicted acetyltransferase
MQTESTSLVLRRLTLKDESAFIAALNSWDSSPGFMFAQHFEPGMNFSDYINKLKANERGEQLLPGYVAATILCGFVGNDLVGRLSIRHSLTDFLLKFGGHIGYGVVPQFRQKGYAKEMLRQALPVAKGLGIQKALITCDDNNIGSLKTIEAHGGILENKLEVEPGKPLKRRYWIEL